MRKPSSLAELKRKQTTAVVLLGVIGAEFGQDISNDCMYQIEKILIKLKILLINLHIYSTY